MTTITEYKVLDKTFSNIEDAKEFEKSISDNLPLRARNLYLFWYKMLGYPGIATAEKLIANFTHNRVFAFGKYKGACIGEMILLNRKYVNWCLENIPSFKLNKEELVLFTMDKSINLGGYGDEFYIPGETYNNTLIDWEIKQLK